jgi:RNA polymerase sigma factor (sigma-70 family)
MSTRRSARGRPARDQPTERRPRAAPVQLVRGDVYVGWDAVYLDNVERLYRIIFAKVGNRHDAEDLTAEVFMAAFGPMRTTASIGEVRAYLLATARTVLAGHWRRTLGREITTIDPARLAERPGGDWGAAPVAAPPAPEAPSELDEILADLPPRHRRILELRFLEGASVREAAAELGVSVGNAKVLQHRALRLAAQARTTRAGGKAGGSTAAGGDQA